MKLYCIHHTPYRLAHTSCRVLWWIGGQHTIIEAWGSSLAHCRIVIRLSFVHIKQQTTQADVLGPRKIFFSRHKSILQGLKKTSPCNACCLMWIKDKIITRWKCAGEDLYFPRSRWYLLFCSYKLSLCCVLLESAFKYQATPLKQKKKNSAAQKIKLNYLTKKSLELSTNGIYHNSPYTIIQEWHFLWMDTNKSSPCDLSDKTNSRWVRFLHYRQY